MLLGEFVYALLKYLEENEDIKNGLSNREKNRISELEHMRVDDCEALNAFRDTKDPQLGKYKINKKLEERLDNVMKDGSDPFHKFVLVYLEICKMFSYDYKYFLALKDAEKIHGDIKHIEEITDKESFVVCYEIVAILAIYLRKLGFNYELIDGEEYGYHTILKFRYEDMLIKVEPIESVYNNDLINVKLGKSLRGITCYNQNLDTRNRFETIMQFYYKESKKDYYSGYLPANKIISCVDIPMNLKESIELIDLALLKVKQEDLNVVEEMSYLIQLIERYKFSSQASYFACEVIKDETSPFNFSVLIILSDSLHGNYYVLYNFSEVKILSQEETQRLFDEEVFSDVRNKRYIKGINH